MMVVVVVPEVMWCYSDAWVHRAKGKGDGRHDDNQSRPTRMELDETTVGAKKSHHFGPAK